MDEVSAITQALSREIQPVRRFFRQWVLYLLVVATIFSISLSPQNTLSYCIIALVGSNLLFLSIYLEEFINSCTNRLS